MKKGAGWNVVARAQLAAAIDAKVRRVLRGFAGRSELAPEIPDPASPASRPKVSPSHTAPPSGRSIQIFWWALGSTVIASPSPAEQQGRSASSVPGAGVS